jgi:hypothetical protein
MSRDRVLSDIRPHLPRFLEVVNGSLGVYYGPEYVRVAPVHSRSSRPNIIRDHMVDRARTIFAGVPGFSPVEVPNGFFGMAFQEKYVFEFKKINRGLYTVKRNTNQYRQFIEQDPMPVLPEVLIDALHLTVGYVPNRYWTIFDGPYIVCPKGKRRYDWYIDIVEELRPSILNLPIAGIPQQQNPARKSSRVRKKGEATEGREQADGTDSES